MVAGFLSRLILATGNEEMVDDQLPYKHLFDILVFSLGFADITNYLVARMFLPNL